ncbi:hypothetical protein TorRG33x02_126570 [Trema orientale]|uniref:Uncharacterized protein n=1 Tax=Trema orientale TaxID=63057 RepID=A0A2P5F1F2_TREOI|nr:hypothetical protein TorRG33x02_126570 [Trema orientale]
MALLCYFLVAHQYINNRFLLELRWTYGEASMDLDSTNDEVWFDSDDSDAFKGPLGTR